MEKLQNYALLKGRILLSAIFLFSGFGKITGWTATAGYMESKGMPAISFFLFMAILFELAGGLSILLGLKTRIGAILLIMFMVPTTLIFHNFWALDGQNYNMQMIHFMKNIAIIGGLFILLGSGPGGFSLDSKLKATASANT